MVANEPAFTLLGYLVIHQPGSSAVKKRNFDETKDASLRTRSVAKCAGELINGQPDDQKRLKK